MFHRITDALYRTLEKVVTLVVIVAVVAFLFRFIKENLKWWMQTRRIKSLIRRYFKEKN